MNYHNLKTPRPGTRPGFTLTELLVVILIIAALAALSFLGTKRIREMADKAGSIRNLSQLQIANVSYASDHNGNFVPIRVNDEKGKATRWFEDREYLANLTGEALDESASQAQTISRSLLDPKVLRARNPPSYDKIYCSYGMNDTGLPLGGEANLKSFHRLSQMPDPARSMAFATATDFRVTYNSRFKWNFEIPNDSKTAAGDMAYRHGKKVLVVYFDGHVGELTKGDLQEIDRTGGGKNNAFWSPTK